MFTGIVTNFGKIIAKSKGKLRIQAEKGLIKKLTPGTSIAVDGICLTVVGSSGDELEIDYIPETENKTNIKYLDAGDLVNLELPSTGSSFLSGHIVLGHIDGVAKLSKIESKGNSRILTLSIPKHMGKYILKKGSIALNGISLTVIDTGDNFFTVGIIPYTWEKTMLHTIKLGDYVNIEVDILAKYVEKLLKTKF